MPLNLDAALLQQLVSIESKSPALGQAASAASTPVVIASNQSALSVTGPLTDTQLRLTPLPVSGTVSANATLSSETTKVIGTVNVSAGQTIATTNAGTFAVQATLGAGSSLVGKVGIDQTTPGTTNKVSIGTDGTVSITNLDVALSTRLKPADTLAGVTTVGAVTSITNALPAGTNRLGATRLVDGSDATLAAVKGTQTAQAVGTQDLKDAGRTTIVLYAVAAAAGTTTTETAISLTKAAGTGATSSANSFVITSGKTFRITSISFATRGNVTATLQSTTFNLRINTAGAVITSSTPVVLSMRSATPATSLAWDRVIVPLPDGLEFAGNGTIQFGVTAAATYVTNAPTWDVTITGFEY